MLESTGNKKRSGSNEAGRLSGIRPVRGVMWVREQEELCTKSECVETRAIRTLGVCPLGKFQVYLTVLPPEVGTHSL